MRAEDFSPKGGTASISNLICLRVMQRRRKRKHNRFFGGNQMRLRFFFGLLVVSAAAAITGCGATGGYNLPPASRLMEPGPGVGGPGPGVLSMPTPGVGQVSYQAPAPGGGGGPMGVATTEVQVLFARPEAMQVSFWDWRKWLRFLADGHTSSTKLFARWRLPAESVRRPRSSWYGIVSNLGIRSANSSVGCLLGTQRHFLFSSPKKTSTKSSLETLSRR